MKFRARANRPLPAARRQSRPARALGRVLAAVLVSSALSLGAAAQTSATPWMPNPGGMFNVPRDPAKQMKLENELVAAINHARPGSYIRISLFSFDRKRVARALVRAHRARHVHVQILLNDHQFTGAQRILKRGLGANRHHRTFSYQCTHGCRSHGENLHTKMFLFSHTGGAHWTVMTGSLNFTWNSVHNQYNDLWVSSGQAALFSAFNRVFQQMRQDKPAHPLYYVQDPVPGLELQALPYPHHSATNDPIITILDKVHCSGANGGTGAPDGHTIVRVNMHSWNNPRGVYLAKKIRQLFAKGCHVQVMYGMAGHRVRAVFAQRTKRGYIPVHSDGYDTDEDGEIDLYSHQKELLISGHYGSSRHYRQVLTGSSNWNDNGVYGDEEIFLIHRHPAYNAYTRNFKFIWAHRSRLVRYIHYGYGRVMIPQEARAAGPAWEND